MDHEESLCALNQPTRRTFLWRTLQAFGACLATAGLARAGVWQAGPRTGSDILWRKAAALLRANALGKVTWVQAGFTHEELSVQLTRVLAAARLPSPTGVTCFGGLGGAPAYPQGPCILTLSYPTGLNVVLTTSEPGGNITFRCSSGNLTLSHAGLAVTPPDAAGPILDQHEWEDCLAESRDAAKEAAGQAIAHNHRAREARVR